MKPWNEIFIPVAAVVFLAVLLFITPNCAYLTCENTGCGPRGTCEKGMCRCDEGWDGLACHQEMTPKQVWIKKVKVTLLPQVLDRGTPPELDSGHQNPHLMLRLWRLNSPLEPWLDGFDEKDFGGVIADYNPLLGVGFALHSGEGGGLHFPTKDYRVALYADDGSGKYDSQDLLISGITFKPYHKGQEFPNPIVLQNSNAIFEMEVAYIFP